MWRPTELGAVVAEREVTFEASGTSRRVSISFGKPVLPPSSVDGAPWWCPVQISGLGREKIHAIAGLDSLQALLLAMRFVRESLPNEAQRHDGKIYWHTEDLDTIFDQRESVRILSEMCDEAIGALQAAEPIISGLRDKESREVGAIVSRAILKYTRDLRLGDGPRDDEPDQADRDVYERAKEVYFRFRDKFEPGEGK